MNKKALRHQLRWDGRLVHIDLEVTRHCNLRCIHCSAASKRRGKEMSVDATEEVLREAKSLGLEKVGLTGGEPFLRREKLMRIGDFCRKELSVPIHVHSNGTMISKRDAAWIERADAEITIPLYGDNATTHESITGKKGSFSSTLKGLENLLNVDANVCVYIVPMKQNLQAIPSLIEFIYDKGIRRARVLSLSPTGRAKLQFEKLELSENDYQRLNTKLTSIRDEMNIDLTAGFCTSQNLTGLSILEGHE